MLTYEFESGEDYCRYCQEVSPSVHIALSKVTDEKKKTSGEKWQKKQRNYGTANGLIKMDNESICIVGTRP